MEEVRVAAAAGPQGRGGHQADFPLQAGQPRQPPPLQERPSGR